MLEIKIRPVALKDVKDIHQYCFTQNTFIQIEDRIKGNIDKQRDGKIAQFVAEVDGRIVGTMMLSFQSHPLFAHRCILDDVVVSGDYQGKGIARKIFEHCADYCKNNNIAMITVNVRGGEPAEKVYLKLGFTEYGRLVSGIVEPWNDNKKYDEVLLAYNI